MPSPAELKRRPEARRKILAMYRSAQLTPLDRNRRTSTSDRCRQASVNEPSTACKLADQGQGHSGQRTSGTSQSMKTRRNKCIACHELTKSSRSVSSRSKSPREHLILQTSHYTLYYITQHFNEKYSNRWVNIHTQRR